MPFARADPLRRAGEPHFAGAEQRPGVALAERGELLDLLHGGERELAQRGLGIDPELRRRGGGTLLRHELAEGEAEGGDAIFLQRKPRRGRVPAVAEQVLRAGLQGFVEVHARGGTG